jgi:cysteine desulfurase/selenocysteine lyase
VTALPRSEFPVTENLAYLNHAATGVPPRCTVEAIVGFVRAQSEKGVLGTFPYELRLPEFRSRLAAFIGASPDEMAFLRSTSGAANVLAHGIDWRAGDEIILCDNEFPANAVPWLTARSRGAVLRYIETARERMTPGVLRRMITSRTRVVTVSWVSFGDGYRHDLATLAEVAHAAGAFLCVDGIQGLGSFPVDVKAEGVDAFYGSGAKWLLALQGIAYLYVSSAMQERLAVAAPGWRSLQNMWDFSSAMSPIDYDQPFVADASRFEGGTPNFVGALSIATSVEFLQRHDRAAVEAHVLALTDRLVEGLQRAGAEIVTPRGPGVSSGIVTFLLPGSDPVELGKRLQREGIVTTYRASGIRVSPHGYNTLDEIGALLEVVSTARATATALD